jgi:excinuclease ABC subunit C
MNSVPFTRLEFAPERDAAIFTSLPAAPAVFLLRGKDADGEPYVSKTANLRRRVVRLLGATEERTRKLNLRDRVATIEYQLTGSDFESGLVLYQVLRQEFPRTYRDRLRLRPAPLVKLNLENPYPRAHLTRRIGGIASRSRYYGPFATRAAAEKFLNDSLDLFKHRRCVDDLNPDPAFPGCIYSEMKMCLAPCFKGCTDEEYARETERVQQFLETGGESLRRELSAERERASAALEFEQAAAMHARLEKAASAMALRPDVARPIDRLHGLMVQPSAASDAVSLFRVDGGFISGPIVFHVAEPGRGRPGSTTAGAPEIAEQKPSAASAKVKSVQPKSMESRIADALAAAPPGSPSSALELMEHLAILRRWYFRTSKTGELFLAEPNGELPMRRIVRGISRVFRGEKPAPDLNESARDYWVNRGKEAEIRRAE